MLHILSSTPMKLYAKCRICGERTIPTPEDLPSAVPEKKNSKPCFSQLSGAVKCVSDMQRRCIFLSCIYFIISSNLRGSFNPCTFQAASFHLKPRFPTGRAMRLFSRERMCILYQPALEPVVGGPFLAARWERLTCVRLNPTLFWGGGARARVNLSVSLRLDIHWRYDRLCSARVCRYFCRRASCFSGARFIGEVLCRFFLDVVPPETSRLSWPVCLCTALCCVHACCT